MIDRNRKIAWRLVLLCSGMGLASPRQGLAERTAILHKSIANENWKKTQALARERFGSGISFSLYNKLGPLGGDLTKVSLPYIKELTVPSMGVFHKLFRKKVLGDHTKDLRLMILNGDPEAFEYAIKMFHGGKANMGVVINKESDWGDFHAAAQKLGLSKELNGFPVKIGVRNVFHNKRRGSNLFGLDDGLLAKLPPQVELRDLLIHESDLEPDRYVEQVALLTLAIAKVKYLKEGVRFPEYKPLPLGGDVWSLLYPDTTKDADWAPPRKHREHWVRAHEDLGLDLGGGGWIASLRPQIGTDLPFRLSRHYVSDFWGQVRLNLRVLSLITGLKRVAQQSFGVTPAITFEEDGKQTSMEDFLKNEFMRGQYDNDFPTLEGMLRKGKLVKSDDKEAVVQFAE